MVVKITTPWDHNYNAQLEFVKSYGVDFQINNGLNEADWWIIWGGLKHSETVNCSNLLYVADESHEERFYNQDFLNQFKQIASVSSHPFHTNRIYIHELTIWYFKNYEERFKKDVFNKTKNISILCSDASGLEGHKKRYALVNKLIGHFKDKIDVYGRGFNYIDDKFDALKDYKYSVAIENKSIPNYFSEKLIECFMTYTLPIYAGCTNIHEYFDADVVFELDLDDYKKSINLIEKILDDDPYEKLREKLSVTRQLYLDKFHLFPALANVVNAISNNSISPPKKLITIKPESGFIPTFQTLQFSSIDDIFKEIAKRFLRKLS
jgi:hypothetical protein